MPQAAGPAILVPEFQERVRRVRALANPEGTGVQREAANTYAAIRRAIDALEANFCAGNAMRGHAVQGLCEYRLDRQVRIIYRVDRPRRVPVLLYLGQHYMKVRASTYLAARAQGQEPLSQALGWDDVYRQVVRGQRLDDAAIRQMVRAVTHLPQNRCC